MCLRRSVTLGVMFVLLSCAKVIAAPPRVTAEDEAVEQYLTDRGLTGLLADHLEARLKGSQPADRPEIAERLATVYAQLLEQAEGLEAQNAWEQRARTLLETSPEANSVELRLGLARAAYKRVEKVVDEWRLRTGAMDEAAIAARRLAELATQFEAVASESNQRIKSLERQEELSKGVESELLTTALATARRHRSQAHYLAGWCGLNIAELSGNTGSLDEVKRHFGWLLNARPGGAPERERLIQQTFRYVHVARSAIAVGTAEALQGRYTEANAWFDAVGVSESLPQGVERHLFLARAYTLSLAQQWTQLADMVEQRRPAASAPNDSAASTAAPLDPSEARRIAVLVFEAQAKNAGRSNDDLIRLRDIVLNDLVAAGELGHVLELVRRYGQENLGGQGFVPQNIRGLLAFDTARQAQSELGGDQLEPVADDQIIQKYRTAAEHLRHATNQEDGAKYPAALANAYYLLGMCLYLAGDGGRISTPAYLEAAQALQDASERFDNAARQADALWLEIKALRRELERKGGNVDEAQTLLATVTNEFGVLFPDDPRSGALMLDRISQSQVKPEEAIEMLLRVPQSSQVYEVSRRQAARLTYDAYRSATADTADWSASRFVEIAEPLLAADRRRASAGDTDAAKRAAVYARQIVDAVLSSSTPDVARAERALDALTSLIAARMIDGEPLQTEIDYRRAQMLLARNAPGDRQAAEQLADSLQSRDPRFAQAANVMFYRDAQSNWRRQQRQNAATRVLVDAAQSVVRHGKRLLTSMEPTDKDGTSPAALSLQAEMADAAAMIWRLEANVDARDLGLLLYRKLLRSQPRDAGFLRGHAELAEAAGEVEPALESLRLLVAGLEQGSNDWFDAKYKLVLILAKRDAKRAAEVLAQHRVLYPGYGPEPWGARFREIADRLPRDSSTSDKGATP